MSGASWRTRFATLFGVWLVIALVAWLAGNQPRPGLLALVLAVGAGILWLFLDLTFESEPTAWPETAEDPIRPPGEDVRLSLLHHVVEQHHDAHEVGDTLHRELTTLADHRLVARHGISLRADPERAASYLGRELTGVTTARPPYPRLSNAQINAVLDRIEAM